MGILTTCEPMLFSKYMNIWMTLFTCKSACTALIACWFTVNKGKHRRQLCSIYHSSTVLAWFLSCMTMEYVYISLRITCLVVYACCTNLCVKSVPSLFRACCLGPLIPIMLLLAAFTMAALGICMAARVVLPWVLQTEEVLVCTLFEWVPTGDCCNIQRGKG